MDKDGTASNAKTHATGPETPIDDDIQGNGDNPPETSDPTDPKSLVAAFRVTFEHDGSVSLSAPLTGGRMLEIVVHSDTLPGVEELIRLPTNDILNPGVALVVRASLERLVKAARSLATEAEPMGDSENAIAATDTQQVTELLAALEPFKEVAP